MRYISILSALILTLLCASCSDDDTIITEGRGTVFEGTVANGYDGCGWLIEVDGENFLPNVLNSRFREEGLEVILKFEIEPERANCGQLALGPQRMRIEQIQSAN